ncbi:MAG: aldo/keto reductase [Syntrophorhabdales bacterium]|jgi:aryl-alcohol dehydrogenase-like predicted oxidoreductase
MKKRELGVNGPMVSAMGLGCLSMTGFYGSGDENEGIATIHRALDLGANFLDTADMYGPFINEELVGRAIRGHRDEVIVATKFGLVRTEDPNFRGVNGRPEYVRSSCEGSLRRLRVESIDLYYQHRLDPNTPVEETVGTMAQLVREGKVRYLGLSEVGPVTLRRAHKIHPITALQSEYSLWTRDPEKEVLATCRELGIGFVAYSPLGRGFLTGRITNVQDLDEDDYRRTLPRFQGDNFEKNLQLLRCIEQIAADKKCRPGQLALAWVLAQGEDIVPVFGTKRRTYLEENLGALDIELTPEDLQRVDDIAPREVAAGPRYMEVMMRLIAD